ncbi:MAG TPA: family 20 glycosylhydrolase [Chitinophagaceae bacterium]|nr:family 20 glycosylhydrolase [Chitinophagaceae bacterium]
MKRLLFLLAVIASAMPAFSQQPTGKEISLLPQPVSATWKDGSFKVPVQLSIVIPNNAEVKSIATRLASRIMVSTKYSIKIKEGSTASANSIFLSLKDDKNIADEGYVLKVTPSGVVLTARKPAGLFYGMQTLLQLFPADIESRSSSGQTSWSIPLVTIEDHPRFGWRGLMLDVSRHFFTKAEVKAYIDDMAKYKFNLLHWHLTDDQGWRLEIKSLPKLTSVGAWRVDRTGKFNEFSPTSPDEPRSYGGFYTQEDVKEIIQYAKERYIDILPEIDVPGHSLAAIASYPELSCTPGTYAVNSGEPFMVWPPSGHFYGLLDNTLCPANEKVYEFMDKVFTEVAQLFPFPYIHMGGDETARNFWEKSEQIKALMQKENLKNLDEVQSYFVKRMENIVVSKGKKLIGWDEILDGGLAPTAAVMSWRGVKGGIEAAKLGHEVVMSPTDFVYIDYMQSDAIMEPPVYASLRLKKTYSWEPIPEGVNASLIKGGQANLWTEQVFTFRQAEYMTWPRGFAVAEILWSPKEKRDWDNFIPRVEAQFKRLDFAKIKYAPSMYDPDFKVTKKDSSGVVVELVPEIPGLQLHYSFDNSYPDEFYPTYKQPLMVPRDAALMKVISYRDGKPIGRMITMPVEVLKKRAGIK